MVSMKHESVASRQPNDSLPTSPGGPLALPPRISSENSKECISRAADIIGAENLAIITKLEKLKKETYSDPSKAHDMFHVFDKSYFVASAVVAQRKVSDVQALVRLSKETVIPVWPFSIGRNAGYGGAAPRVPGSIDLDMDHHVNRVLEVNESGAYALAEPGVTFVDLYRYLVQKGLD